MGFGGHLRRARRAKDISQVELCAELGISIKHLSEIENAKAYPSFELLVRLLDRLEIEVPPFLTEDVERLRLEPPRRRAVPRKGNVHA